MIRMGFFISISKVLVTEFSTSCTSPLILARMSPFLSWLKKPSGSTMILLYICVRRSLTIPVRIGTMIAAAPK